MKKFILFVTLLTLWRQQLYAQPADCTFKPFITVHFGSGSNLRDINSVSPADYERVATSCPSDGYYAYTSYTSDCFSGDWLTLAEDHTPGDVNGNMMLVNASYNTGTFFSTTLSGLKSNTIYEFGLWLMNVCRISDKCPFPLLPNITIRLKTPAGRTVAQFSTGELARRTAPHWTQYRGIFTLRASETAVVITMQDNAPGGCGNDFAMDDMTIRECIKPNPVVKQKPVSLPIKQQTQTTKAVMKKEQPKAVITKKSEPAKKIITPGITQPEAEKPMVKQKPVVFAPPPAILRSRANPLIKQIETEAGEIKIDLYDNGEIDGDTVSIYHNNELIVSNAKLSQKPISFFVTVDAQHPHHELVMVAKNLGSIPPNTSLMIVTAGSKRYQAFISSTEQKNAKVEIDLKQ